MIRHLLAVTAFTAAFVTALIAGPPTSAHAQPTEDSPGWSCIETQTRVCGPASDDYGHTPGCYDDGGVLVALWPCYVVVDPTTGEADVYTPEAR